MIGLPVEKTYDGPTKRFWAGGVEGMLPELVQTLERALEAGDGLGLPVWFHREVLRRYQARGASLGPTDHAGRLFWLAHLACPPVSAKFLKMRLRPSRVDDGELRDLELD